MHPTDSQVVREQHFSLLELLDRLLDKGVMVKGEILLSIADIDLVYLNLGLLLSSVKTVEQAARRGSQGETALTAWHTTTQDRFFDEQGLGISREDELPAPCLPASFVEEQRLEASIHEEVASRTLLSTAHSALDSSLEAKANVDAKNVEKGLVKLVLTLVELLRKLMEKQAIRRVESGQLYAGEIDRLGETFFLLDERMEQLKQTFGLQDEDLNLDLGPLGNLL